MTAHAIAAMIQSMMMLRTRFFNAQTNTNPASTTAAYTIYPTPARQELSDGPGSNWFNNQYNPAMAATYKTQSPTHQNRMSMMIDAIMDMIGTMIQQLVSAQSICVSAKDWINSPTDRLSMTFVREPIFRRNAFISRQDVRKQHICTNGLSQTTADRMASTVASANRVMVKKSHTNSIPVDRTCTRPTHENRINAKGQR